LALVLAIGLGLITLWLKKRPQPQSTRETGVTLITPIQADSTLQEEEKRRIMTASTGWVNATEPGAALGTMAVPVPDDQREGRVTVNINTVEYTISGDTALELLRSMDRAAPLNERSEHHAGHTEWHVSYHYGCERSNQGCRTRPVSAEVNVTFDMPHWANAPGAVVSLQTEWDRFISALWVHERGHAEHGIQAANDIKTELEGLPPAADCEAAGTHAKAVAQEILRRYVDTDVNYDRETEGGKTQGAWLERR
jgi:predicted secreted Zn-dependent protease